MTDQKAIDTIASLIYAAVWADRRQAVGESGTKAIAMLKQQSAAVFEGITGRRPTEDEMKRLGLLPEPSCSM